MKIKIKDANLYNCEGFMTDIELVDKINTVFKTDTEVGMTLHGLTQVAPRDFFASTMGDGEGFFTKAEMARVIKYLYTFDLTLNNMVVANKYKTAYGESRQIQVTNLDPIVSHVEYGRDLTDAEVDKAFEEAEACQDIVDKENPTPVVTQ